MKSLPVFFVLLVTATVINAREAPRDYLKDVMKNQPLPEALQGLLEANPKSTYKQKADCHTSLQPKESTQDFHGSMEGEAEEGNIFVKDFEPTPNLTIYHDDSKTNEKQSSMKSEGKEQKKFTKEFEQTPSLTIYHG